MGGKQLNRMISEDSMHKYYIVSDERRETKTGKPFAILSLRKPDGMAIEAKAWDATFPSLNGKVIEAELVNQPFCFHARHSDVLMFLVPFPK